MGGARLYVYLNTVAVSRHLITAHRPIVAIGRAIRSLLWPLSANASLLVCNHSLLCTLRASVYHKYFHHTGRAELNAPIGVCLVYNQHTDKQR